MSATCPRCIARGKTWTGDDPRCGFPAGRFVANNWNCATLNLLRDLTEREHRYGNEDNAVLLPRPDGEAGFVVLCWYKSRGRTDRAFVLTSDWRRSLSLKEAEALIRLRLCRVPGCERPIQSRELCQTHYCAARREGLPLKGSQSTQLEQWKEEARGSCAICNRRLRVGRRVLCGEADCQRAYWSTYAADTRRAAR